MPAQGVTRRHLVRACFTPWAQTETGKQYDIFGSGGAKRTSHDLDIPFLKDRTVKDTSATGGHALEPRCFHQQ
jgi:hypothetical protein